MKSATVVTDTGGLGVITRGNFPLLPAGGLLNVNGTYLMVNVVGTVDLSS